MLATLPSHQRRDVAALQLTWATKLTDEKSWLCWVEGSAKAVSLYERFGFEKMDEIVSICVTGEGKEMGHVTTCMLRLPEGGKGEGRVEEGKEQEDKQAV
ncbi:uncharacterized protein RSE6_08044 [Rhynchosporium secalis]|uniref:N-acetyltransferase domain-containing protein n=1 Tax=Rhynchosporium secalis TaxID=38038 RepID=A0A1E1MEF2_RHYSE|nr:uncharacterized protein RSE6_08044 [Rhynchosporium secalis]